MKIGLGEQLAALFDDVGEGAFGPLVVDVGRRTTVDLVHRSPFGAGDRPNNTAAGLSGMLLYSEGAFLQVLEGPEAVIQQTFDRIERDRRHHRVLRLFGGEVQKRSFGEWSMGFVNGRDPAVAHLTGFTDFLRKGWNKHSGLETSERINAIATQFRNGR